MPVDAHWQPRRRPTSADPSSMRPAFDTVRLIGYGRSRNPAVMKPTKQPASGTHRGRGARQSVRPPQSPPLARAMVIEALETWVVPALSVIAAATFWLLATLDVWPPSVAVVGVGGALLVLTLFTSFRHYFLANRARHRQASLAFAVFWGAFLFVSFFRSIFPGAPLASGVLRARGDPLASLQAGLYAVVVDGRFTGAEGKGNRRGHYQIEATASGGTKSLIEGDFEDSFARQRLGRRGTTVVEIQHTSQRHVARLPAEASLRLTEIDKSLEPEVQVTLYSAINPWIFPIFGITGVLGALALEKWLDGDGSATMAASATFFVVDQYLRWAAPHPQMKSLIGAVLVGGFIGAPLAAILWRVVPRRWIVRIRQR